MPLIKSQNAPATLQPFSMTDIENAAKRILLRARAQAEQLLIAAQQEGESLKQAAQAKGLADGRAEGMTRGMAEGKKTGHDQAVAENRQKLIELMSAMAAGISQIDKNRHALEADAVQEVIDLALAIAQRVTKRQAAGDPAVVCANVAEAMKLVVHGSDLRIAVHPSQRATLMDTLPRLQMQWPALAHVQLIDDPGLTPGGCRVYTLHGQIDAEIEGQLQRIAEELVPNNSGKEA